MSFNQEKIKLSYIIRYIRDDDAQDIYSLRGIDGVSENTMSILNLL
jgi:hypothetical protein